MKLSIIIISWNVAAQLERCLASVSAAKKPSLPLEVIVVDNASSDGTPDMIRARFPKTALIVNSDNKGFAVACNQGIRIARGEYMCFLNPDTEVNTEALQKLVAYLDTNADVGIVAPRLRNDDGSIQKSIRRFPTPLALLEIFFKLDRLPIPLAATRNYMATDFDYLLTQEVEQPMGACLVVRKKTLDTAGLFDERFFIWFEEVDLCKRIKESGYKIVYLADASIIHQRAQSFSKQDLLIRQRNFYTSARRYLDKHYPADRIARAASSIFESYTALISFFISLRAGIPQKREGAFFDMSVFACAFLAIGAIEFISILVYSDFIPPIGAFLMVSAAAAGLALWRPDIGAGILLAELIIGSKGYLFSIDSWDWRFPIRMALFSAVLFAWGVRFTRDVIVAVKDKQPIPVPLIARSRFLWWYVAMGGIVAYGFIAAGIFGNPFSNSINDGNAWLFFLAAPVLYEAFRTRDTLPFVVALIAAGVGAQTIKVLLTFYVMGHEGFTNVILTPWYHWIRNTGVGEITSLPSMMTRVFFQSQIFALAVFAGIGAFTLMYFIRRCDVRRETVRAAIVHGLVKYRWMIFFQSVLCASLIVSFSRSLWIAAVASVATLLFWAVLHGVSRKALSGLFVMMTACAASGFLLLVVISGIPFPATSGFFDIRSVQQRVSDVDDEAAAASRWQLLPVLINAIRQNPISGYGFGKTVTYESNDPRIARGDTSARYTTFAFEWGYLDIWIKLGIVGIALYLSFLAAMILYGFSVSKQLKIQKRFSESALALGIVLGIIALVVTHIFTPYLNHPLGIGIIMIAGIMLERLAEQKQARLIAD
ncbi:glycosyltransferase [Candidatus Uhrbacteria bacterium]|nr:glycosyltransferase [Candidatus Uhrbacteria bacterium]